MSFYLCHLCKGIILSWDEPLTVRNEKVWLMSIGKWAWTQPCSEIRVCELIVNQISAFDKLYQACHAESLWATSHWHEAPYFETCCRCQTKTEGCNSISIFYFVTSTEKKNSGMNWEQQFSPCHKRFSPIKKLLLQTNHTSYSNKQQQTTCKCISILCMLKG